jgi:hypothetical protein
MMVKGQKSVASSPIHSLNLRRSNVFRPLGIFKRERSEKI